MISDRISGAFVIIFGHFPILFMVIQHCIFQFLKKKICSVRYNLEALYKSRLTLISFF